jgi:DNA-binding transcriptional LysR family regulator
MIEEIPGDFLQWLRGFYFVAKKKSVTQAAQDMGRNQPTVTHQIKCLESQFGVTLFDRSTGKMELTPEGGLFLEKAVSLFEIVKEMKSEFNQDRLEYKGKIIGAATHAIIRFFLPSYVKTFGATRPNVTFALEGGGLEMILAKVESAEADFGIACVDEIPNTIEYHDLFETELKLIAPKNNNFFSKRPPTLRQISKVPFVCFPRSSTITPFLKRRFMEEQLQLKEILTLNDFDTVKTYVAMGLGVSILDSFTLLKEDERNLDIFPLRRLFTTRRYGLLLRKKKYLSPLAKAFIRTIKPNIQINK